MLAAEHERLGAQPENKGRSRNESKQTLPPLRLLLAHFLGSPQRGEEHTISRISEIKVIKSRWNSDEWRTRKL